MRAIMFAMGALCLFIFIDCNPAQLCVPGKTDSCACLGGGQSGVQTCKADGSGWSTCVCPGEQRDGGSGDKVATETVLEAPQDVFTEPVEQRSELGLDSADAGFVDFADANVESASESIARCNPGQIVDCYTGAPGTSKVGECRPGKQTCKPEAVWGACEGEVTPVKEEASRCDGRDNDCNGLVDEGCKETLPKAMLVSPEDGSTVARPTFSWTPVSGAVGYVVVLQKSITGDAIWRSDFVSFPKTETTYPSNANPLTSNLRYYWYVFAFSSMPKDPKTDAGDSRSDIRSFKVQ